MTLAITKTEITKLEDVDGQIWAEVNAVIRIHVGELIVFNKPQYHGKSQSKKKGTRKR